MSLLKKRTEGAFKSNVGELVSSWKRKGSIGQQAISSLGNARRKALAIAFRIKRGE